MSLKSSSSLPIMMMLFCFMLFATLSCCSSSSSSIFVYGREGRKVGGRMEVKDVKNNKEIQKLGKFCVEEFNKNLERDIQNGLVSRNDEYEFLNYNEVVEAEKQVVSGLKYYLKISALTSVSGVEKKFDAVVVVKPWIRSKVLLNFAPSVN
ncbi:cysteine proteinase inhibitor B-like [Papaver somniferum]|uniref:cysteine proteinase inhibitor B-like n=1 Tax=Papaver somniferum TaxID=3469 RepID=UPI000E701962|nr:cysteine proteinase inhibitor B-like [Papaver somniferum]